MSNAKLKISGQAVTIDVGPILNLSGAKNQVEGCVVNALSTAQLEITFANCAAQQK